MNAPNALTDGGPLLARGAGTLERRKGVYIVHLRGTHEEMGRQHAQLAHEICGDLVPQYLNGLIEKMIAHALPALARPLGFALKRIFHGLNRARMGQALSDNLRGFAEVFGTRTADAERVLFVPDILHYLAGRAFVPLAFPPMCSGFFACGNATRDGKLIIGRNFDFFGRGVWNTSNAIIVMHPENGQRIVWLGALGASGSAQAFNESGITLSLHTKFTRDVALTGVPVFALCHDVLANATTLEEAIARVTAHPRLCGLTAFLVDTRARTAAAVGFSARHAEVVPAEHDTLVRTNHYTTQHMRQLEIAPHAWQQNSRGRFQRVTELLAEKRGALTPRDVPGILSDCVDPYAGCRCVAGSIVAGANNTQSIVFSPDDDAIWVGNADHPVCHSERFAGFRVSALLAGDRDRYEIEDLEGAHQLSEMETAALAEYEQAWSEYVDNLNCDQAVFHLRRAMALLPDEPLFPRMAGIILLKEKRLVQALPLLLRNAAHGHRDPLMHAEAHVWAGRCLDLMRRREEALAHYTQAAALNAPPVSTAAKRHLRKPFKARGLFEVAPEFVVGTGLARY
jgi:hypothetical protein